MEVLGGSREALWELLEAPRQQIIDVHKCSIKNVIDSGNLGTGRLPRAPEPPWLQTIDFQ